MSDSTSAPSYFCAIYGLFFLKTYPFLFIIRGSQQYNGDTLALATDHQKNITANLGGTELYRTLAHVFKDMKTIKGYPRHVSFILFSI